MEKPQKVTVTDEMRALGAKARCKSRPGRVCSVLCAQCQDEADEVLDAALSPPAIPVSAAMIDAGNQAVGGKGGRRAYIANIYRAMRALEPKTKEELAPEPTPPFWKCSHNGPWKEVHLPAQHVRSCAKCHEIMSMIQVDS